MKTYYRMIQKATSGKSGTINIPKEVFDLWMSREYENIRIYLEQNGDLTITPL